MSATGTTTSGQPLAHAPFTVAPRHIPNGKGRAFKTELVERRDPKAQTIKWHWWHLPDDDRPPHNHPWKDAEGISFISEILQGGYTEERYWLEGGEVKREKVTYKAGDRNVMPYHVYHTVIAVEPGTLTRMVTGPAVPENEWGYLDPVTGEYTRAQMDPTFMDRLRALNEFIPVPKMA